MDVYGEALRMASGIRDDYIRAITCARVGYYMYRAKNPDYKTAFKYALNAVASIENPALTVKALIEIGTHLKGIDPKASQKVFQQAYESITEFPEPLRDDLLGELVTRLLELNLPNDALFYAVDIRDSVKRNDLLLKVLRIYLRNGNMRRAWLVVERIDEEPWRSIAQLETIKEHLKREEFGSAIRILSELKSEYWLEEAMKEVAVHLKNASVPVDTYEKFVEVALGMSSEGGFEVLRSLLIGLARQGEIDFVMGILERLQPGERLSLLEDIAKTSIDSKEALSALLGRLEGEEFERVAGVVMDGLLSKRADSRYLSIIREVGERTREDAIRVKVTTYLSKLGEFDEALKFARSVRGNYLRSLAFGSVAVYRLKSGDIDGAIDAAREVKDPRWGSWLLSEILTRILEQQAGGEVRENLEEGAERQRVLWEKH
ncbi:hypothetical protein A3L12_00860 [Thermococcus sp. P6]|uniref:hypothetical protein n=1 Tax=Thermococcus sp. P6 TaxID=122420 RepID=UPI000B5A1A56|nr:hypothetical protein [Thermococcus sp. P6]ASJ09949.1 hypothetical protein A3L12_00860 [Thermococcus sp. P6]